MADDSLEQRLGRPSDLSFQFCQLPLDSAARVPLHSTDSIWPTQTLLSCTNLWLVLFLTQYPRLPLTLRYHFELLVCKRAKSLQSCLTLCDPMDCSPPDSSVHRILQARILEWVAKHSSRGSSLHSSAVSFHFTLAPFSLGATTSKSMMKTSVHVSFLSYGKYKIIFILYNLNYIL